MKRHISSIFMAAGLLVATSCNKYLDINDNPNQATESTPKYVLPNALVNTASSVAVTYHDYGAFVVGYEVNAGGYGGWGSNFTYNYSTTENNGLWTGMFNNLRDYQFILDSSTGDATQVYYNAAARIMKCFDYQMLVDQYGDVPYTDALKGTGNLTPKYDKAEAIYQDLVAQLNKAIADIKGANTNIAVNPGSSDVLFKGDMPSWIRFANTLKLRILLRASNSSISAFVNTNLTGFDASGGFLNEDALVNPGYIVTSGKQNPAWNTYHSDAAGTATATGKSRIPSAYIMTFYNGTKLSDTKRGSLTYKNFGTTPVNQLGNESNPTPPNAITGYPAWYIGTGTGSGAPNALGVLKGRTMGQPILLAAESYFLLAEAAMKGYAFAGAAQTNFNNGIIASFAYLEKDISNTPTIAQAIAGSNGSTAKADATAYQTANAGNYLANYNLAATDAQRLEAIITQKYIALNFIHGHEAWNEYRRTGYPVSTGTDKTTSFASLLSQSSRPDRLPVRNLYPQSEYLYNPSNVPTGINVFTSRIFWDAN